MGGLTYHKPSSPKPGAPSQSSQHPAALIFSVDWGQGISGAELADRMRAQAERFGVEFLTAQTASAVEPAAEKGSPHTSTTETGQQYRAPAVLLAPGSRYRRLDVPGENDFIGAGIHFCATCDGPFYQDMDTLVVGGGKLSAVLVEDLMTGQVEELHPAGAFVFIGLDPNTGFLANAVELDPRGSIITRANMETNRHGIFAAGDARAGSTKQVAPRWARERRL